MWSLKVIGQEKYLPKTPYTQEEMEGDLLTNKPDRIGKYVHKGYALKLQRDLAHERFEVIEYN
jgi:hypothetical protein